MVSDEDSLDAERPEDIVNAHADAATQRVAMARIILD